MMALSTFNKLHDRLSFKTCMAGLNLVMSSTETIPKSVNIYFHRKRLLIFLLSKGVYHRSMDFQKMSKVGLTDQILGHNCIQHRRPYLQHTSTLTSDSTSCEDA